LRLSALKVKESLGDYLSKRTVKKSGYLRIERNPPEGSNSESLREHVFGGILRRLKTRRIERYAWQRHKLKGLQRRGRLGALCPHVT
jgi:hypothetical protein